MIQNKPIIWQMSKDYKPENKVQYILGCDDYLPEEGLNFWNKIKKKLGLKYKVKERNGYIPVGKIETINGKQVISYEGRK